jgi:hypothetical protein
MNKWIRFFAASILVIGGNAFAAKPSKFKNFVPGKYSLVEGEYSLCKSGDFELDADGSRIRLGPHYVFFTKDTVLTGKSDFVIEKGCDEKTTYTTTIKGKQTFVKSIDVISCKGEVRLTTVNEATLTKAKISLTQSHDLNPKDSDKPGGTPHSCVWKVAKK